MMHVATMEEELLPPDRQPNPHAKPVSVTLYPRHVLAADKRAHRQGMSRSEYIQRLIEADNPTEFPAPQERC